MSLNKGALWAEISSAALVFISLVLAVFVYFKESDKQRREFTLDLALEYFSHELQPSSNYLFKTIQNIQADVSPIRLGASDVKVYISKSEKFSTLSDERLNMALLQITSFFNAAKRCVDAGLCDERLMKDLIAEDATATWCVFEGYLMLIEKSANVKKMNVGLEYFSDGECA